MTAGSGYAEKKKKMRLPKRNPTLVPPPDRVRSLHRTSLTHISPPPPSLPAPQLLRERVQTCYMKEGVNHYQNCRDEVKAYLESIKNVGVHRANIGVHDRAGGI